MKHYGDITKISGYDIEIPNVITGGSPCQDLSVAGLRQGLSGERSGLFMEQIRITKELREKDVRTNQHIGMAINPRFFVWENVVGAISSGSPKGEDFRIVLEEICRITDPDASIPRPSKWSNAGCIMLESGGSVAWRIHDAQFWGTPQRRRRLCVIADFGGTSAPEILFEREGVSGDYKSCEQQRERVAAYAEGSVDGTNREGVCIGNGQTNQSTGTKTGALNCMHDQQAVLCLGFDRAAYNQGKNAKYDFSITENTIATQTARGPGGVCITK